MQGRTDPVLVLTAGHLRMRSAVNAVVSSVCQDYMSSPHARLVKLHAFACTAECSWTQLTAVPNESKLRLPRISRQHRQMLVSPSAVARLPIPCSTITHSAASPCCCRLQPVLQCAHTSAPNVLANALLLCRWQHRSRCDCLCARALRTILSTIVTQYFCLWPRASVDTANRLACHIATQACCLQPALPAACSATSSATGIIVISRSSTLYALPGLRKWDGGLDLKGGVVRCTAGQQVHAQVRNVLSANFALESKPSHPCCRFSTQDVVSSPHIRGTTQTLALQLTTFELVSLQCVKQHAATR